MKKKLLSLILFFTVVGAHAQIYISGNIKYEDVLYSSSGALDEASIISTGQGDAYDGVYEITIDGNSFTNAPAGSDTTINPNTINTANQIISELLVSKHYYFSEELPILRHIVKIENPTGEDKSTLLNIYSNFGSDNGTELDSCSTGNGTLSNADRWTITSDGYSDVTPNGDPIITWVRFGPGTTEVENHFYNQPGPGNGYLADSMRVTLLPNSIKYIMQFSRLDSTVVTAKANVSMFDDVNNIISNDLLVGIHLNDYSKIVNWDIPITISSNLNFSNVNASSFTLNWTNGIGTKRLVIIREGDEINQDPTNGTTYTASSVFGNGTELGTGNYVIYSGSGNSVDVTGLKANTTYFIKVFEYNITHDQADYLTSNGLTGSQVTSLTDNIEIQESEEISLYPNPNNGTVTIGFKPENQVSEIQIVNTSGVVVNVISIDSEANSVNINTSTLKSGLYFIHFSNTGIVKKMIKY